MGVDGGMAPLDDPSSAPGQPGDYQESPPWRYDPQYLETETQNDGYFEFLEPAVGYSIYVSYWKDGYLSGSAYQSIEGLTEDVVLSLELTPLVMTSATGKVIDETGKPVKNAYVEFIFAGDEIKYYEDDTTTIGMPNDPSWSGFGDAALDNKGSGGSVPSAPPGMEMNQGGSGGSLDNPLMQQYRWEGKNNHTGQAVGDQPFTGYYGLTTNDNGEFTIESLPVGAYYTFASAYKHLAISGDVKIVETSSENYIEFTISTIPVGSIAGVVKDEFGVVVANALVNCVQPYVDPFTYTDENGEYRIDNIPTGDWIVSAFKYGYQTDSQDVTIGEDQVHTINLNITTYTPPQVTTVHFTGRVIDGVTGDGIVGARMIFTTSDNQFFSDATSVDNGFYSVDLIPTEYNVLIQSPDYQDVYIRFYVDSLYPEFDFSLWPISGGMGPWGGIMPGMGGGWFDGGGQTGGEAPMDDGTTQPVPPSFDPDQMFENRR
jgi:hypothetical protein